MAKKEKLWEAPRERITDEEIEQMTRREKGFIEEWVLGIPLTSFEYFGLRKITRDVVREAEQMHEEKSGMNFASYYGEITERFLSDYYGMTLKEVHKIFKIGSNDKPTEESREYFRRKQKEYFIN